MKNNHIDVTIDFSECGVLTSYDLRIPTQISVKQLLLDIIHILKLNDVDVKESRSVIKIKTKCIVLADDDMLIDYPVTTGDVLTVL
ncbi:EsaB/YukD family protein [Salipaludibacillus sp. HK11]|uniref:EsaB/YukD family protein n=1 Tax=Salipaludibacillus sp. HK11 TaxID=3394320 RepID=UPI0039FCEF86